MKNLSILLRRVLDFFSSYALAAAIFVFLLILTYLGTVEQIEHGLFETQQRYFNSLFVVHEFGGVLPIPLPGVRLLLVLLFINILAGGFLRMRKGVGQIGILVIHGGILLLLVGGFITYEFSVDGHMTLYEEERSNVFESYHDWEVVAAGRDAQGQLVEFAIASEQLRGLDGDETLTLSHEDLPFDLLLSQFARNAQPAPAGPAVPMPNKVVDGFFLQPLEVAPDNERNVAGAYATAITKDAQPQAFEMILWGMQRAPVQVSAAGSQWSIDLRRKRWEVPFTIVLKQFRRELHPRTTMAKAFESDVVKIEDGIAQDYNISMNAPLRHKGYTFFQASWGPPNAGPNTPLYSSFAVVKNPADRFPLYACIVISFGMLIHFSLKLSKYLRAERRRAAA